ncbi:MAG: alpha/beta hydrolase family protein [Planctomycetota bacterium]|jgi:pimeloyl-ACP methyl ester carboxylesterase
MNTSTSQIYIVVSIAVLAVIALFVVFKGKSRKENRLTPLAGFAFGFILAGILFGDDRLIGYSLLGIGVILAGIDMFKKSKSNGAVLLPTMLLTVLWLALGGSICSASVSAQLNDGVVTEEITFSNDKITLAGTLTLPLGDAPHPAVVLISGSGPHDRDGAMKTLPGYRPFAIIAEDLSRKGVAVLRYDDRGVGKSSGDYLAAIESDFVKDAEAALHYLVRREDITTGKVGVLGHSEGSMIAAMVAANNPRVAFLISLAGGAVDGYSLLLRQTERMAEAEGMTEEEVANSVREQRRIFDLVLEKEWEDLKVTIYEIILKRLKALPKERVKALGDLDTFARRKASQSLRVFQHPRYQFLLRHDFGKDWERVSVPVLALFGELDVQCDASQNKVALKQALARTENDDVKIIIVPDANHLFLKARTGSLSEYATIPKNFASGLLESISTWLLEKDILK